MIPTAFLLAWIVLLIAPKTPIARGLHRMIVAAPARLLAQIGRGHVLLVLLAAVVMGGAFLIFDGEVVRVLSLAAPDALAWATMIDLATVLDAAFAAVVLASSVRWRALRFGRPTRRPQSSQRRRTTIRPERPAANDDDEDRSRKAA